MRNRFLVLVYLAVGILWLNIGNEFLNAPDAPLHAYLGRQLASKSLSEWVVLKWSETGPLFFQHPHLLPWLEALSVKLLGTTTFAAVLPAVLSSTLAVLAVYGIGATVLDEGFGLLAATLLVLTPRFVKFGRNPMIEPLLSFLVFAAVYFGLRGLREKRVLPFLYGGIMVGLAFLSKGPPSVIALGILVGFYVFELALFRKKSRFLLPAGKLAAALALMLAVPAAMVLAVDLWHRRMTGVSFYSHFLNFLYQQGTGEAPIQSRDLLFYVKVVVFGFWPWWPLAIIAPILAPRLRGGKAMDAAILASLGFFGTLAGFTLIALKNDWYLNLALPAFAMLAAIPIWLWLKPAWMDRYYNRAVGGLAILVTTTCAIFPPLFEMPRPILSFVSGAGAALGNKVAGQRISDCVPLHDWTGPFLVGYYLGASRVPCNEHAPYAMIPAEKVLGYQRVLFASDPYLLVAQGK